MTKTKDSTDLTVRTNWMDLKGRLIQLFDDTQLEKTNEFCLCYDNGSSLTFVVDETTELHITHSYYSVIALVIYIDGHGYRHVQLEWFGNHCMELTSTSYETEAHEFIESIQKIFERYYIYQIGWEIPDRIGKKMGYCEDGFTKDVCLLTIQDFGEFRNLDLPASNDGVKYFLRRVRFVHGKVQPWTTKKPTHNRELTVKLSAE